MTMPLPKMTKAHRMFLYGVLASGAMAVFIAALTIAVFLFVKKPVQDPVAYTAERNQVPVIATDKEVPGANNPVVASPEPQEIVSGLIREVKDGAIVMLLKDGSTFTIYITGDTKLAMVDARAKNPIEQHPLTSTTIPNDQMAHATLRKGTKDVAAELIVVKDHD